jgi:hypothetical protein
MTGPPEQVVQHLVPHHHLVHRKILGQVDLMAGLPMAGAVTARAGEAVARDD